MEIAFYNEAQKIWDQLTADGILKDVNFELKLHKKILDIFHVGNFYYWIFDIRNFKFYYMSPNIKKVLGYEAENIDLEYFMSKIHPDDQMIFLNHENTVLEFFKQLPLEKMMKYKVSYDYRVISKNNLPIRILHQVIVLQHDEKNNVLITLGVHTDISHLKTSNKSSLSFIGLENEPSYINVTVKNKFRASNEIFTKREKEIVQHLLQGKKSAEIAKLLYISKYTVDTHRKNILLKTNTSTTLDLAVKVINEGLV